MFGVTQFLRLDDTSFEAMLCIPIKRGIKND